MLSQFFQHIEVFLAGKTLANTHLLLQPGLRRNQIHYLPEDPAGIVRLNGHFSRGKPDQYFRFKEKKYGETGFIRIAGLQFFYLILQIITQVTKNPAFLFIDKSLQPVEGRPAVYPYPPSFSRTEKTFLRMRLNPVLVVVQKAKGAELLYPVQHLFFGLYEIGNGICAVSKVCMVQCFERVC